MIITISLRDYDAPEVGAAARFMFEFASLGATVAAFKAAIAEKNKGFFAGQDLASLSRRQAEWMFFVRGFSLRPHELREFGPIAFAKLCMVAIENLHFIAVLEEPPTVSRIYERLRELVASAQELSRELGLRPPAWPSAISPDGVLNWLENLIERIPVISNDPRADFCVAEWRRQTVQKQIVAAANKNPNWEPIGSEKHLVLIVKRRLLQLGEPFLPRRSGRLSKTQQ